MLHLKNHKLNSNIDIALGMSSDVIIGAGTLINSIIYNNTDLNITVHIFSLEKDLLKIKQLLVPRFSNLLKNKLSLKFYNISKFTEIINLYSNSKTILKKINRNITLATMYRLVIPKYIKTLNSKVLYIDTDIICDGNISQLSVLDLSENVIAAVKDWDDMYDYAVNKLHGFDGDGYFNAGVLLINIDKWNQLDLTQNTIDYIYEYNPLNVDQDALNVVCSKKVFWLKSSFNTIARANGEITFQNKDIIFYHFTGANKPWKPWIINTNTELVLLYKKYLEMFEPDSHLWFNHEFDVTDENVLWNPTSINDYKMIAKNIKKHSLFSYFKYMFIHYKLKFERLGLFNILLGK